ncbi:hypothetical protein ACKKBF_B39000 [Auxenochlorella protothecoides x Auxenochlorella symbiontica]
MSRFSSRSTAQDVVRGVDLTGKVAVVTGGNAGIGVETVRALAGAGADVVFTSRNVEAGNKVVDRLQAEGVKGKLTVKQLDLASLNDIQSRVEAIQAAAPVIDYLILNAGVLSGPAKTKEGFEMSIGTNHIGHFHFTKCLLPKLKKQGRPARVVVLSSRAHFGARDLPMDDLNWERRRYSAWPAYNASKLCNLLFAKELARRTREAGDDIEVFALHPGVIGTSLFSGESLSNFAVRIAKAIPFFPLLKSPEQGAATSVYAATSPELNGQSGAYLSDCKVTGTSALGQDANLAKQLWEKTEEMIAGALRS